MNPQARSTTLDATGILHRCDGPVLGEHVARVMGGAAPGRMPWATCAR